MSISRTAKGLTLSVLWLLAVVAGAPVGAAAEEPAAAGGMPPCHAMMSSQKEMAAEMTAMDARLSELASRMETAQGSERIDAVAAVVAELVAQHQAMMRHMHAAQGMAGGCAGMKCGGDKGCCAGMGCGGDKGCCAGMGGGEHPDCPMMKPGGEMGHPHGMHSPKCEADPQHDG